MFPTFISNISSENACGRCLCHREGRNQSEPSAALYTCLLLMILCDSLCKLHLSMFSSAMCGSNEATKCPTAKKVTTTLGKHFYLFLLIFSNEHISFIDPVLAWIIIDEYSCFSVQSSNLMQQEKVNSVLEFIAFDYSQWYWGGGKKTEGIEKTILLAIMKTHKFQGKILIFLETKSV